MADRSPGTRRVTWSGGYVLLIPLLMTLLALVPVPRSILAWADSKVLDLFLLLPLRPMPDHPVVVVAKDETFSQIFPRDTPHRGDFAQALQILAAAGVRVAGFDFLFDAPQREETDGPFLRALQEFPAVVLADLFQRRKAVGGLEQITVAEEAGGPVPAPVPLYLPIGEAATDLGLTNIFLDVDRIVRYVPLAFLTGQSAEFLPTLGFATWIQHLLAKAEADLAAAALPAIPAPGPAFAEQAGGWLRAAVGAGPRPLASTGHAGLDQLLRRRELRWLARQASRGQGSATRALWIGQADRMPAADLGSRTWLDLPPEGIPWMGSEEAPCLRLPFTRLSWPRKGDGIQVVPLGFLLSAFSLGGLNSLEVNARLAASGPVDLEFDRGTPGSGTLGGTVLDLAGRPLAGVAVLTWLAEGGYWASATTDPEGKFRLAALPPGTYTVELIRQEGDLTQTLTTKTFLPSGRVGEPAVADLPTARFLPGTVSLTADLPPSGTARSLVVTGDPVWIERTGPGGALSLPALPPGFTLTALDDGPELSWNGSGGPVTAASQPAAGRTVGITETEPPWQARLVGVVRIPAGNGGEVRLSGLPPGLAMRVFLLGQATGREGKPEPVELDFWAGETARLASLPAVTAGEMDPVALEFRLPPSLKNRGSLAFLHSSGLWREDGGSGVGRGRDPSDKHVFSLEPGSWRIFWSDGTNRGSFNRLGALFNRRPVLFGTHLAEDQDFQVTPVNFLDPDFKKVPGVNLHAQMFSVLARRDFLRPTVLHPDASPLTWPLWNGLLLLPLLLVLEMVFRRGGAVTGGLAALALCAAWSGTGLAMFLRGRLLPVVFPGLTLGAFGVVRGFQAYLESRQRERQVRASFSRFVSDKMVAEIVRNPDSVKPGGEKTEITVMFTDLAGFTSFSEMLTAEQLGALMNEYLGEMTNILFQFDGTLDKYIGDAVMSFWNYPAPQKDHALRAARCALAMQKRLAELRVSWKARGLPEVSMRAGINTAECMVGFFGSAVQMNFTCLGDGVNLSSRLEGANKAYHTLMMVSESTHRRLAGSEIRTRFLDFLAVKGKHEPIKVFELIGVQGEDDQLWNEVLPLYDRGIAAYLARDWNGAEAAFRAILERLPGDGPSLTYLERVAVFRLEPPPQDWDGSFHLKTK